MRVPLAERACMDRCAICRVAVTGRLAQVLHAERLNIAQPETTITALHEGTMSCLHLACFGLLQNISIFLNAETDNVEDERYGQRSRLRPKLNLRSTGTEKSSL